MKYCKYELLSGHAHVLETVLCTRYKKSETYEHFVSPFDFFFFLFGVCDHFKKRFVPKDELFGGVRANVDFGHRGVFRLDH